MNPSAPEQPEKEVVRGSNPTQETELADVVVADKTRDNPLVPWYVTLRPWLFCLAFLLLAELATRLYFDTSTCLQTERLDNFPTPALENAFAAQMRRDTAYKVVVIGDLTVVGSALLAKSETIPVYLEQALCAALPRQNIHVWNFSVAGARSLDEMCLLQKALEGKPDCIVVEGNYFTTSLDVSQRPLAEPWLAYNLASIPPALAPYVPERDAKKRFEDALTWSIEENCRFMGLRQAINAKLFGVQPRVPYSLPNPAVMTGVGVAKKMGRLGMMPWNGRGFQLQNFLADYRRDFDETDLNCQFYRHLAQMVSDTHLPCLFYITPQNPAATNYAIPKAIYASSRKALADSMTAPGVTCKDYSELVPDPLFHDNDHMLPDGNRLLANALAADLAPHISMIADASKISASARSQSASVKNRP